MKYDEMMLSEVFDSPKSAIEFMKMNKIKDALIVVIWVEKYKIPKTKKVKKK